ncbi:hypothetical protein [Amantichitinum ursilacus]|uniref:Uncharacterized protein n=1 Tax=Amantichitinum ursilacus TaxID=857265 RepID=A0A0N0GLW5_9NEIS|nr:hypothetical protein [Amantichitinum ursilacus]KPC50506.1 hypothetical protein WG78_16915 [Amantichitinum ursilacus]
MNRNLIQAARAIYTTGAGAIKRKLTTRSRSATQSSPLPLYKGSAASGTDTATEAPYLLVAAELPEQSTADWLATLSAQQRVSTEAPAVSGSHVAPTPASVYAIPEPTPTTFTTSG